MHYQCSFSNREHYYHYIKYGTYYETLLAKFEKESSGEDFKVIDLIEKLFFSAKNVDEEYGIGTVFTIIVRSKYVRPSIIIKMLELGVDSRYYIEMLYYCFHLNDVDFLKYLVYDLCIDINNLVINGIPFEHLNNPSLVKILLDNGFDFINKSTLFGSYPELIELLLENGVDLEKILSSTNFSFQSNKYLIDRIKNTMALLIKKT